MPEFTVEELEQQLASCLGCEIPQNAVFDVSAALRLADMMKAKGYEFDLDDLCRKSLTDSNWLATFSKDDMEFAAEDPQASLAICVAALGALSEA